MLKNKAFTLIEIMVVVAIIGVMAAMLVPQLAKAIERSKVSRTTSELTTIRNAENAYFTDVGSYPPCVWEYGRPWGADVSLVDKSGITGSHSSSWNGPYLQNWPVRTAWGGLVGCGATGAYYVHGPTCWINRDGLGGCNDNWVHMNPYCAQYPPSMGIEIDKAMDDGNSGAGVLRLTGGWPEYVYYYVGEGTRSW